MRTIAAGDGKQRCAGEGMRRSLARCHNPAMSGPRVFIQTADFDLAKEVAALRADDKRVGAVCSFVGTVRDRNDGDAVASMELEHYPGMTEKSIEAMIDEAHRRFDILGARVIHRVGLLQPLDQIMMVAVISAHRGQSFQACEFLMDYLKTQAPFWKKEQTPEGARWVDARVDDDAALARWGIQAGNA
jgi:molybdopterin synthase catalytic subunit